MKFVVDANVWVGAMSRDEPTHQKCLLFLMNAEFAGAEFIAPVVSPIEVVATFARKTNCDELAAKIVSWMRSYCTLWRVMLCNDIDYVSRVASQCRLRGADAVYVATALESSATLVTYDREILERASSLISVATPEDVFS